METTQTKHQINWKYCITNTFKCEMMCEKQIYDQCQMLNSFTCKTKIENERFKGKLIFIFHHFSLGSATTLQRIYRESQ